MSLQKQFSSKAIKRFLIATVFLITFSLGVVGLNANAKAQENSFSCTLATLNGLYGVQGSGFRLTTEDSYTPFGAINIRNFDGNGNYTGSGITNVSGTFAKTNISGTYTVEPDCTVELRDATTSTDGVVRNFSQSGTIVKSGREIFTLQTSPTDNVQTGIFKKVS